MSVVSFSYLQQVLPSLFHMVPKMWPPCLIKTKILTSADEMSCRVFTTLAFFQEFFQGGGKSIVMQISFVMLLFLDQVSGRGKSFQGGAPLNPPPVEESQQLQV